MGVGCSLIIDVVAHLSCQDVIAVRDHVGIRRRKIWPDAEGGKLRVIDSPSVKPNKTKSQITGRAILQSTVRGLCIEVVPRV